MILEIPFTLITQSKVIMMHTVANYSQTVVLCYTCRYICKYNALQNFPVSYDTRFRARKEAPSYVEEVMALS